MNRLTEKNDNHYCLAKPYINWTNGVQRGWDKLGQIEDLMEKYNISDLDSLEVLVEYGIKAYKKEQDAKTEELKRWREGKNE